jgi:hypothetical protein
VIRISSGSLCFANANFVKERQALNKWSREGFYYPLITAVYELFSLVPEYWSGSWKKMTFKKLPREMSEP